VRLEPDRNRQHYDGMGEKCRKRLERLLMTGADAQMSVDILAVFEAIKGRKPTRQEIVRLHRKIPVGKDAKPPR
jgi:hypothetical protein